MVTGIELAVTCLTLNIFKEARGEPLAGQMAVALVTLNRVKAAGLEKDICTVVFEKGQFSWTNTGMSNGVLIPSKRPDRNSKDWKLSESVAKYVMFSKLPDFTKGATFYHTKDLNLKRDKYQEQTLAIGNHVFFKEKVHEKVALR